MALLPGEVPGEVRARGATVRIGRRPLGRVGVRVGYYPYPFPHPYEYPQAQAQAQAQAPAPAPAQA